MHPREVGIYIQESRDVLQSHSLDEITQRGKKVSKTMWREGKGPEDAKRWGDQEISKEGSEHRQMLPKGRGTKR